MARNQKKVPVPLFSFTENLPQSVSEKGFFRMPVPGTKCEMNSVPILLDGRCVFWDNKSQQKRKLE